MEQEELKRKLMGLWEKTTHKSKELLNVLFDFYFNIDYIEYVEHDGKIVSALCGIPYNFGFGSHILKGIYLISLTLEEGYHKKGFLSELLSSFNNRWAHKFDFSFIVPANDLMADYYGEQGYISSFYILEERYTANHDFRNDYYLSLVDSDERIKELKRVLFDEIKVCLLRQNDTILKEKIIQYITTLESKSWRPGYIVHRPKDLDYLLNQDSIPHLQAFVAFDSEEKISGVAFTRKEEPGKSKVVAFYVSDQCSYFALLDFIKLTFSDDSLTVNTSDPKYQNLAIIQQTYASANVNGGDLDNTFSVVEMPFNINRLLHSLGMVKILNFENIFSYIAQVRSDVDFKLILRDLNICDQYLTAAENIGFSCKEVVYVVKGGKFSIEPPTNVKNDKSILRLNCKEVSDLLLRKNDSSNLIMEAFGIPRLNLQVRLLPC